MTELKTLLALTAGPAVSISPSNAAVILHTDNPAVPSYGNGKPSDQQGWLRQTAAQVSIAGSGTVTTVGEPFDGNGVDPFRLAPL